LAEGLSVRTYAEVHGLIYPDLTSILTATPAGCAL